jgi:hypothetical protein
MLLKTEYSFQIFKVQLYYQILKIRFKPIYYEKKKLLRMIILQIHSQLEV